MSATTATTATTHQRAVLEAFDRATNKELHNLRVRPGLAWQQLHNRLQWEGDAVERRLAVERDRRRAGTAWFRTRTPFRESAALIRTLTTSPAARCLVSSDGSFVASTTQDGTLHFWDPMTGVERRQLELDGAPRVLALGRDARFLLAVSDQDHLALFDLSTGMRSVAFEGHSGEIHGGAVSPDGSFVVSASADGTLKVWDATSGSVLHTLAGHRDTLLYSFGTDRRQEELGWSGNTVQTEPSLGHRVLACAVSPDASFIVSASEDRTLKIWDSRTGQEVSTLTGNGGAVHACAVAPDGSYVVSASEEMLTVFGLNGQGGRRTLRGHGGPVNACAVSPDGSFVVSASDDGELKLWDPVVGTEMRSLQGHAGKVRGCAVGPDGRWIASAGGDGVKIWDLGMREPATRPGHSGPVTGCAVGPDDAYIVSASALGTRGRTFSGHDTGAARAGGWGTVTCWDAVTSEELATVDRHTGWPSGCPVSPDGSFVAFSTANQTLTLWDPRTGRTRDDLSLSAHTGPPVAFAVGAESAFIVSAGSDGTLKLWDPAAGTELRTLEGHAGAVTDCAVSPDGSFVVSASADGKLKLWDPHTGEELRTIEAGTGAVLACAVSPDRSFLVSGGQDATLRIFDLVHQREPRVLEGHAAPVNGCAISPDGSLVVSVSDDGTVRMWQASTAKELAVLPLTGQVQCVATSHHGAWAVCGDSGGGVVRVDLESVGLRAIIVTATRRVTGLVIRCPACQREDSLEPDRLGSERTCPTPGCGLPLRVNPFVAVAPVTTRDVWEAVDAEEHRQSGERPQGTSLGWRMRLRLWWWRTFGT
jgi:WD40 repeat protein